MSNDKESPYSQLERSRQVCDAVRGRDDVTRPDERPAALERHVRRAPDGVTQVRQPRVLTDLGVLTADDTGLDHEGFAALFCGGELAAVLVAEESGKS